MKLILPFALVLLLVASGACKKPILEVREKFIPPLVVSTSIQDSLPPEAVSALNLSHIVGLKIKYATGLYANYFEYHADQNHVLATLSELPFTMQGVVADTQCHSVSFEEITVLQQNLSTTEIGSTDFFWTTDPASVDVFECIKPPFRHTIQIAKNSNHILHRIEFLGYS